MSLILASDGVLDVITPEEAARSAHVRPANAAALEIMKNTLEKYSKDNATVMVVRLRTIAEKKDSDLEEPDLGTGTPLVTSSQDIVAPPENT